jgi:hypothetical protein
MAIMEQMRKPVPDAGVVRHTGEEALLHVSREIGPQPKRRPAKDLFIIRHRHSPLLNARIKNPRRWMPFLLSVLYSTQSPTRGEGHGFRPIKLSPPA